MCSSGSGHATTPLSTHINTLPRLNKRQIRSLLHALSSRSQSRSSLRAPDPPCIPQLPACKVRRSGFNGRFALCKDCVESFVSTGSDRRGFFSWKFVRLYMYELLLCVRADIVALNVRCAVLTVLLSSQKKKCTI